MEVRCDKCQARYRVDDARIGPLGLTMRCGKCQNTFKVMRAAAPATPEPPAATPEPPAAMPQPAAPAQPAAKAAPRAPAQPAVQGTMVFAAPTTAKPAPPPPAKPVPPRPAATEEGAGRTMMFQTGNLKSAPPPKPRPQAQPEGGATLVFGGGAAPKVAPPAEAPKPASPARDEGAGSTMTFGAAQTLAKPKAAPAAPVRTIPEMPAPAAAAPPTPAPVPPPAEEGMADAAAQAEADPPAEPSAEAEAQAEPPPAESGVEAEGAETEPRPQPGTFDKAPPKGLLIGVAAGLALLLIAGGGLVAYKKLSRHPPPPAAVETLSSAQADADKDTLASIASAEGKAKDALDVAGPRSRFPEGAATLARIELQWADALSDEAARLGDGDAKSAELEKQAAAKAKAAYEVASAALKVKGQEAAPELQLALADYYRFKRSTASMNRYLKNVKDDPRAALIEGMAQAQDEDSADKGIPRLKAALAQAPQSARVHFRLALAYAALKDDANARAETTQTLKLSPQHERAKALLEQLGPASAAPPK